MRFSTARRRAGDLVLSALIAALFIAAIAHLPSGVPERLAGPAFVIDGDSLEIIGTPVRLSGIDAPEAGQTCERAGESWPCGTQAARALRQHMAGRTVECRPRATDRFDRLLAECFVGDENLNRWLVAQGWAVSDGAYLDAERAARAEGLGIWAGTFESPAAWRARHAP